MSPAPPENVEQQHHLTFARRCRWLTELFHSVAVHGRARKLGAPSGVSVASLWEKEVSSGRGASLIQRVSFSICRKGPGHVGFRPTLCERYLLGQSMGRPYRARVKPERLSNYADAHHGDLFPGPAIKMQRPARWDHRFGGDGCIRRRPTWKFGSSLLLAQTGFFTQAATRTQFVGMTTQLTSPHPGRVHDIWYGAGTMDNLPFQTSQSSLADRDDLMPIVQPMLIGW
jgi:hypothetical protein